MNIENELINIRKMAYSPYYKFQVGAVLITKDNKIYTGCNIENITQGPGICAERVAFAKAISDGIKDFKEIHIIGGKENQAPISITPCGVCRQFLVEFCEPDFKIICHYGNPFQTKEYLLKNLLPESFDNI